MAVINPNGIEYLKQLELNEKKTREELAEERTKAQRNKLLMQLNEINSSKEDVIDFLDTIKELRGNLLYKYYEEWFKDSSLHNFLQDGDITMSELPEVLWFISGSHTLPNCIGGYVHVNIEYIPRESKFFFYNNVVNTQYNISLPNDNDDNFNKFINDEYLTYYFQYDTILSIIDKELKKFLNDFKIWMNNLGKESEK